MTEAAVTLEPAPGGRLRAKRILTIAAVVLVVGLVSYALGWDLRAWFSDLWDTVTSISFQYLLGGVALQTVQTLFKAEAWLWILRYAYPDGNVQRKEVLACYAAATAMNGFLPANAGTFAMLLMFVAIIPGATFSGVFAAYLVQKIFFTVIGTAVYIYLFASVAGSFDIKFSWIHDHPWFTLLIVAGGAFIVLIAVRIISQKLKKIWENAKQGGAILSQPRAYFTRVFTPQFLGWSAGLGVIAVFLAAYGIPVTFHTVMSVVGGNSVANVTAVTPGSVGVTQAFNVASLSDVTTTENATAYSVGQQLFTTAWNIILGIVLLTWVFGWAGGKTLVRSSYSGAKEKAAEQSAERKARREAKKAGESGDQA
jgi:uncharacterized membrane protein YbhN (UPF0104 family)